MDPISCLDCGVTARSGSRKPPASRLLLTLHLSRQLYGALACFCVDFPELSAELDDALDVPLDTRSRRDWVRLVMEAKIAARFTEMLEFVPMGERFFTTVSGMQLREQWAATLASAN